MGKHRQKQHHRRIIVAAVAMGVVGVPTAAMACGAWPDNGGDRHYSAAGNTVEHPWNRPDWYHHWSRDEAREPTPVASRTVTAPAHWKAAAAKHRIRPSHSVPKATASPHPTATPKPTAPKPTATASPSTPKPTATASGVVARIVELVNAERAKAGCAPVTLNATLTKAAQAHSADMASHQNMSHTGSDGSSPGDRITRAGYVWSTYGENIAYGYSTPEQVMAGWMSSPGHKANILNCAFKEIGVGLAQPGSYWTQDFGTAR
ncbi:CAP domain-containing protein [Streptomyces sp. NK08204]|uniref:CAP domain-containing protein n=1 Tax=Streptomyces sp. NK08204 TaxID=2873260 RepID=UPI001CED4901|nr:CAP domain-containing protein [Streptomyces sp. NK08204]